MPFSLIYWIIMLLWLLSAVGVHFGVIGGVWAGANWLLLFILFVLLGWKIFGPPAYP